MAQTAVAVMKRYEIKYILSKEQTDYLVEAIKGKLFPDKTPGVLEILYFALCFSKHKTRRSLLRA